MPSLLIVASYPESIPRFRGELIESLTASGVDVTLAAPGLPAISQACERLGVGPERIFDLPLERNGTNPIEDLRLALALVRLMRRTRPAAILCYTVKPVIYGTLAAWLTGVPRRYALITGLGYAFTSQRAGLLSKLVMSLYRVALRRVDKVFFQNRDDQTEFQSRGLLASSVPSLVVNGSGVDLTQFLPMPLPVPADEVTFLMIARLLGDKGVREFVQAARTVGSLRPGGARFRLVGWLDSNPDSIDQAELDGWISEGIIEFLGKLEDVRPVIADATVYVLPSYREGTPRTVLEAMAMGRAIITTDAPGCRETVVDGENGFLVPVGSVDALAAAMLRFIDSPGLAVRMGQQSRHRAEAKYDVREVNAVMIREMDLTPMGDE